MTSRTSPERDLLRETLRGFRPLGVEILLSLYPAPKDLGGLSAEIRSLKTSILHELKRLREDQLVDREDSRYVLTGVGRIYAVFFTQFVAASSLVRSDPEFWLRHSLAGIPEPLLLRIGALREAVLVRNDALHLNRIHEHFLELLAESRELKGISPIFHPDFAGAVAKMLLQGYRVHLVVTSEVLREIQATMQQMDVGVPDIRPLIEGNLVLYVTEECRLALSATERFISLGLFDVWGTYDYDTDLFCTQPQGIQWGHDLFEYYRERSTRIEDLADRL